jgi:hypothetical protein
MHPRARQKSVPQATNASVGSADVGRMTLNRAMFVALSLTLCSGCAYIPLRRNTINQARTVADIHQQQVLNNLAMFVYNPNSMPCFAYPTQGTNQVTNTANGGVTQGFGQIVQGPRAGHYLPNASGLSFNATYQSNEAFTLVPINDPRKLELMRCAYQRAVANCSASSPATHCPDCQARFNVFYTGDPDGNIAEKTGGIVTSECLKSDCCWFHVGCKKCLPKSCDCIYTGHYCGVYVWVLPEGRDALAKLTLAILDYAMHDPPVRLSKTVEFYVDEHGLPTTQKDSVGWVSASIGINERNESLLNISAKEQSALEQQLKGQLENVEDQLRELDLSKNSPAATTLLEERRLLTSKLEFLKNQANLEGLDNEFIPRDQTLLGPSTPGPISPNLLQYNQLLNQIK